MTDAPGGKIRLFVPIAIPDGATAYRRAMRAPEEERPLALSEWSISS